MVWRISLAGRRGEGTAEIIQKAYSLRPVLIILTVLIGLLYLWIAYDAYKIAKQTDSNPLGLLFMVLVIFFIIGWQIGDINPVALVSDLDEAMDPLSRVVWPWSRAITYPEELVAAEVQIQVPCTDDPPAPPEEVEGQVFITASPTCGVLSDQEGTTGTQITVQGNNWEPGKEVNILWEDPIGC